MDIKTYQRKIQKQANLVMLGYLLLCYAMGVLFAFLYPSWNWAIGLGTSILAIFVFFAFLWKSRTALRYSVGVCLAGFLVQFYLQTNGRQEVYYAFFVSAIVLIFYQDVRAYVPFILVIALSQILLQVSALQKIIDLPTWIGTGLDIGLMLVAVVTCMILAYVLQHLNWEKYQQQQKLEERIKSLETSLDWIMHISEGELTHTNDQVLYGIAGGTRLIEMKNRLVQARTLEEKEKFMSLGLAKIAEIVSAHDYDMDDLSQKVLHEILLYFEAQLGTLYLLESTEEGEKLMLKASYACNPEKYNREILEADEGFIGQALQARTVLEMQEVPDNFFQISSGLGKIKPTSVLAVPLQNNEDVVGVMEIATFHKLEPYKIELLEKIAESVASSILGIKFNNTTAQLLMESRELAARLQAQEATIHDHLRSYEEQLALKEREIEELKKKVG
jgi:hypothetical protein